MFLVHSKGLLRLNSRRNTLRLFTTVSRCLNYPRFNQTQCRKAEKFANSRRHFVSMYTSEERDLNEKQSEGRVIDLRSDTVTKPTEEMRAAMAAAEVGDDVYGEDPTVNALQAKAAELTGKDAALFIASGTMGNLVSVMAYCSGRGDELFVGDMAHITIWEQGGVAQVIYQTQGRVLHQDIQTQTPRSGLKMRHSKIAGVHPRQLQTNPDGTLDLLDIESKIRSKDNDHVPISRLICIEQTHNGTGGRVLSLEYVQKVKELSTRHGLKVHMDGARLFNAATALGVPVAQIAQHVDSVTFCLSKALGAPVGSIVAGDKDFISRCRRHRKVLGGGMRQAGVLAAAGIYALDNIAPKLHLDHANAQILAKGIHDMEDLGLEIDLKSVETNMVFFNINHPKVSRDELVKRMLDITDSEPVETRVAVRSFAALEKNRIRLVLHHQVSEDDVYKTLQKIRFILSS